MVLAIRTELPKLFLNICKIYKLIMMIFAIPLFHISSRNNYYIYFSFKIKIQVKYILSFFYISWLIDKK